MALLLAKGAHVDACDQFGLTPLHEAARFGFQECVAMLLARGANVSLVAPTLCLPAATCTR